MNREVINTIISEEIDKVITEDSDRDLAKLIRKFLGKRKKEKIPHAPKKKKQGEKPNKKLRKLANGGKEYYDYDDYEMKNKKISKGDASSIRNTIDTEKTNMAAIARILFPDHTEEGAQSQFRKIINGERPMTKKIASKIEKLISGGHIAVK